MRANSSRRAACCGLALLALLWGCDESPRKRQMADPSLYEPPIVRNDAPMAEGKGDTGPARTLKPTVVSGIAMAPQALFDGKLRILVPQTFTKMSAADLSKRFSGSARPDAVFEGADGNVFIVVALLTDPLVPSKVESEFPAAKRALAATYPDCPNRTETLAVLDGRTWMRFDLDGEKRAMIAMTSLEGRQLRIETIFIEKPEQKWVDVIKKMWETALISDGKS